MQDDQLQRAIHVIRGLRSVIACNGRGFMDNFHIAVADSFLREFSEPKYPGEEREVFEQD